MPHDKLRLLTQKNAHGWNCLETAEIAHEGKIGEHMLSRGSDDSLDLRRGLRTYASIAPKDFPGR